MVVGCARASLELPLFTSRITRYRWPARHPDTSVKEKALIVTTTPSVEGKKIQQYRGIVTGEAIMGANIFKDLFAGIRDIVGGRSAVYEQELQRARDIALAELQQRAHILGANAVVGVRLTTSTCEADGSRWQVSRPVYTGTAVRI